MRKLSNNKSEDIIRSAAREFFDKLVRHDLHNDPRVFKLMDAVLREDGYMISCEQRGIYGVVLKLVRVED